MLGNEQRAKMQFKYWDLRRKGMTQSEIARKFGITRQAVSKSVKLHERDVMYRLLETAQTSSILVEWFDASRGILIGITPQLNDLPCLILMDERGKVRTFFDQSINTRRELALSVLDDLKERIHTCLGIDIREETSFKAILRSVYKG